MYDDYPTSDTVSIIHEQFTKMKLLTQDIHIKEQTISILQEKISELEEIVNESQKLREQSERQFRAQNDEYNAIFENQSKKTKQLQQFNQQLLLALKEVQDKNAQLLDKIQNQEIELQQQQQGKLEIHQQLNMLKQGVQDIENDLMTAQKRNHQLKKQKQELQKELDQISLDFMEIQKKESQVNNIFVQCEQENELLRQEISDIRKAHENQQEETVELRFLKKNYDELQRKYDDTVQQFNLSLVAHRKNEEVYVEKLNELNSIRHNTEKRIKMQEQEKNRMQQQISQLENKIAQQTSYFQTHQEHLQQKFFEIREGFLQQSSRKTSGSVQRQSTNNSVYERLYEKSTKSRRGQQCSSVKKSDLNNKKSKVIQENQNGLTQQQIEEFFQTLKNYLTEKNEREFSLLQENQGLKEQITDLLQATEQMKQQLDEYQASVEQIQDTGTKHTDLVVRLEGEQRKAWARYELENEKHRLTLNELHEARDQVDKMEIIIDQLNQEYSILLETNMNLKGELENLKILYT